MSKSAIISNVTRTFGKIGLKAKKHSPEILVISGIIGTVASAVMACKATTKVDSIISETKDEMDKIHTIAAQDREDYTQEDAKKDTVIVYTHTAVKFAKLYGPSLLLGAASIASILAGHNILRKRNAAIMAAYTAVDKGFKEYRNNVIERFGKDVDHELRHNIKAKEIETVVTDKDGNKKTVTETVKAADPNKYSDFARVYDDGCKGWTKDPEQNLMFLKLQQSYANKRLKEEGYLFLNDVYEMLGFLKTSAGQVVGWIYDEDIPNGDNFVDFGIYNIDNPKANDFVNGYERSIVLDFNVDGIIYDKI